MSSTQKLTDVRGPMDTLVDPLDLEPATERAPAPDPADFPASETRIGLFGLGPLSRRRN